MLTKNQNVAGSIDAIRDPTTEFTLFRKLPTELRLKIFKHALPIGSKGFRILKVNCDFVIVDEEGGGEEEEEEEEKQKTKRPGRKNPFAIKLKPRSNPKSYFRFNLEENSDSKAVRDIALSEVCTESRGLFLKTFPQSVRTEGEGLIRFAEEDILYIVGIKDSLDRIDYGFYDMEIFEKVIVPKLALRVDYFLNLGIIDNFLASACFVLLSRFQDLRVVGVVWNLVDRHMSDDEHQDKALNAVEEIGEMWKGNGNWAVDEIPELRLLDASGNLVELRRLEA